MATPSCSKSIGSCDFCGEVDDNAIQYAGYCICTSCRKKIGSMKK